MLLLVDDITIRLGDFECFAGSHWALDATEKWAVLGPTGSGKTILARAISRQYGLSKGQIRYFFDPEVYPFGRTYLLPGEVLTFSAESHQQFLQSFAGYHQARWQSFEGEDAPVVSDLLNPTRIFAHSPFEVAPISKDQAFFSKRDQLLNLFGIEPLVDRKIHLLSHGESRKVFLSQLILRAPKLLILDDPLAGLDEATRVRFITNLGTLFQAYHLPILFLTSRVDEIPASISHLLIIEKHRISTQGKRSAVKQIPVLTVTEKTAKAEKVSNVDFDAVVSHYADSLHKNALQIGDEIIAMQKVNISYQGTDVLKNIDWSVQRGERWALRGPNGAGKTTLLSLILGDNPQAYRNHFSLFGRRRGSGESIWQIKQKIGWVSPELQIFYERTLSCLDVVNSGFFNSIGLFHQCTPEQASISRQWMHALGIENLASQPLESLSTGQQRLVLLARALVKEPPLLILDEPCQGLDDQHRHDFIQLIDRLCQKTPLTLIYVTHYRDELPAAITNQIIIDQGMIVEITSPKPEPIPQPQSPRGPIARV